MSQIALTEPLVVVRRPSASRTPLLVLCLLLTIAFGPLWLHYWHEWTAEDSAFGFGYFVPPSVAYLVWANRDLLAEAPDSRPSWRGWIALGAFGLIQTVAMLAEFPALEGMAMMGVLMSGGYCLLGPAKYRIVWPSLAYTATMIPWPGDLTAALLFRLQQISIQSSAWIFGCLGLKPSVQDALLTLPHYKFLVAPACAGLTVLFPVLACAVFTAITLKAKLPNKLLYVGLSIPLSVLTNSSRIVLIGLIGNGGGAAAAAKLHDASGIFSVLICLGILSLIGRLIGCRKYLPQYAPTWSQKEQTV